MIEKYLPALWIGTSVGIVVISYINLQISTASHVDNPAAAVGLVVGGVMFFASPLIDKFLYPKN